MTSTTREEMDAKFWSLVKIGGPDECWNWSGSTMGGRGDHRYGAFSDGRWTYYAHRFAFSVKVGPIPNHAKVLHECDNPLCCNPKHLFLGTQKDNVRDMMAKGRAYKASGDDHGMARLTSEQVLAVFKDPRTQKTIAKEYGVGLTCISNIKTGLTWGHVTGKKRAA